MISNLFVFHGADHKVGTTMIAQSTAQIISDGNKDIKILLISLNGRESTEYVRENPASIDSMKKHIDNKMLNGRDFLRTCSHVDNLYMVAGIANEIEERYYLPDSAEYLLETVAPQFDIIIADCGNEIDNGLAVGALSNSREIFILLTQQESVLKRFERLKDIYDDLAIKASGYVINKYYRQDPYTLEYIAERLQIDARNLMKVESAGYSRQAEIDYKTLIEYKNDEYNQDIIKIANCILKRSGFEEIKKQRKNKWKSFI